MKIETTKAAIVAVFPTLPRHSATLSRNGWILHNERFQMAENDRRYVLDIDEGDAPAFQEYQGTEEDDL